MGPFLRAGGVPPARMPRHVTGAIFSTVYEGGNPANAIDHVPTVEVGPSQSAVLEFEVNEPGDYRFVDTAGANSYKGALGVFRATS
jgi:hypothetical protein